MFWLLFKASLIVLFFSQKYEDERKIQDFSNCMSNRRVKDKARQKAWLNFLNMFSCSFSLCVDTWSNGRFPAKPGCGWLNWTGGLLRIKGWVDGATDLSGETDGEQVIQAYRSLCWDKQGQMALGRQQWTHFRMYNDVILFKHA